MKKILVGAVAMLLASCAFAASVQDVADRYMKLVLAIGVHDSSYVDAYYGPPELQKQATDAKKTLATIRAEVDAALKDLAAQKAADADEALRIEFLKKQLGSMLTRIDMLNGQKFSFDDETARLYDAVSPHHDRAYYMKLVARDRQAVAGQRHGAGAPGRLPREDGDPEGQAQAGVRRVDQGMPRTQRQVHRRCRPTKASCWSS